MKNDLKKYYSNEFKITLRKLRTQSIVRTILGAFLVVAYFLNKTTFQLVLAIFGGLLFITFLITTIGLFVHPETFISENKKR